MVEMVMRRKGDLYLPFSAMDRQAGLVFPESTPLIARISGAKKIRSYRELSCYFGSCEYIASHNFNPNMNVKEKVDYLTRVELGFVRETVFDDRGLLHWIVDELKYETCDQPKAHSFFQKAFEQHAALLGVYDVDKYVRMLKELR